MPKRLPQIALLTAVAIWGMAGPIIKYTQLFIPTFTLLFFRLFFVCLITFPFFLKAIKKQPFAKKDIVILIFLGLLGQTFNLTLSFMALARTSALEGMVVATLNPIMTMVAGVLILKERIVRLEKIGLTVIALGAGLSIVEAVLQFEKGTSLNLYGDLLMLLAGLTWAAFVILSKEIFARYQPIPITLFTFYVGLATFLPLMLWEQLFTQAGAQTNLWQALPGILYLSVGSSIAGYLLYEYGLQKVEASVADVFAYLTPIFAILPAFLLLREIPTETMILSGGIITGGVLIFNKGVSLPRRHLRRNKL